MKIAIYNTLGEVPEADRADYKLVTEAGSPNFNKYVLDLDPQHPVAMKNVELLNEKTTRDAAQAAAVQAAVAPKEAQIQNLTQQLQTAQSQSSLPANHIAVPADTLTLLNNYKALGDLDAVKAKVDEHGILKEKDEVNTRKTLFSDIAKAKGMDEEVFSDLAEAEKLHEKIEARESTDDKGNKSTDWFVKGKDDKGADSFQNVNDFAKTDPKFKKFEKSLFLSETEKRSRVTIPNQKHGELPANKSGGSTYVSKTYKRPDAKTAE